MGRQVPTLISPNPQINELRQNGLWFIEHFNREPHIATKADIKWFWGDYDLEIDSEVAWEYVNENLHELNAQYSFGVTEWFMEFYRYMPDCLEFNWDKVGAPDWNIFFTLAYPLPHLTYTSFQITIKKLNIAQTRQLKINLKEEIWNSEELREKLFKGEPISAYYLQYFTYAHLRNYIIDRKKKALRNRDAAYIRTFKELRETYKDEINQMIAGGKTGEEIAQWVQTMVTQSS